MALAANIGTHTLCILRLSLTQDRMVLDNDCFTPIKYQKNCGFTNTHDSKGCVGSLDFHPNETVMRYPNSAKVVSERAR